MSFRKQSSVSQKRSYIPACVGDACKGKKTAPPQMRSNAFAALTLSDSEEEAPLRLQKQPLTLQEAEASDPWSQTMQRGGIQWGDLLVDEENGVSLEESLARVSRRARIDEMSRVRSAQREAAERAERTAAAVARAAAAVAEEIADVEAHNARLERMAEKEEEFYTQSFNAELSEITSYRYNTADLTQEQYEECMTWLYANGWHVEEESRDFIHAIPDDLPPRVWIPMSERPAPVAPKKKVSGATVPRFCRDSCGGVPCASATCRYVHGDTMPRLDKPCGFGAACGASDPTGVKRSQCLYMHPGETWSADLVICRPAAVAVAVADP